MPTASSKMLAVRPENAFGSLASNNKHPGDGNKSAPTTQPRQHQPLKPTKSESPRYVKHFQSALLLIFILYAVICLLLTILQPTGVTVGEFRNIWEELGDNECKVSLLALMVTLFSPYNRNMNVLVPFPRLHRELWLACC
jgi:hypothetical protein